MFLVSLLLSSVIALSSESPLSPPVRTPAPYEQHLTGVASNGRDFLAIWLDRRSTLAPLPYVFGAIPLYVSKLDSDGRPQNPFGFKLRDGAVTAALVYTSSGYVALWSENGETDAMLLSDDGLPMSAPRHLADGYLVAAASNGGSIFVIHGPFSEPRFASVFNLDGKLLSQTRLESAPFRKNMRAMVMPNGDYGFVAQRWHCQGTVPCTVTATLVTLSESGATESHALQPLSQWSQSAAAIGNGRLLLAWISDDIGSDPHRFAAFRIFDTAGNPITSEKIIAGTNESMISGTFAPSVGWDGQQFLLAWPWPSADEQSGEIRALRVTTDGVVIDGAPMVLSPTLGGTPWFAANGTRQLVAWDTQAFMNSDIVGRSARSFDTMNYAASTLLTESAALQTEVQLATVGSKTLAVWRERDINSSILASFLGEAPMTISQSGPLDQQMPAIGASRDGYLVVWREEPYQPYPAGARQRFRILGKRVAADGTLLDRDPVMIADDPMPFFVPGANTLAVASDGTDFFVVWPAPGDRLVGTRVTAAGVVLDRLPIEISGPPNGTAGSPRAVWNGSRYVIVWTADPSCKLCGAPPGPPNSQIFSAEVTSDGSLIQTEKIWNGGYGSRVALARGAGGLMLAWGISADVVVRQACVYAMPLGADGLPAGSVRAITCTVSQSWPQQFPDVDIAWDGKSFVLAWTELASGVTAARAIRIGTDAAPLDSAPFDLAQAASPSFQAALTSLTDGVLVAYDRIAFEPEYGSVARLFARTLGSDAAPPRKRTVTH